MNDPNLKSSLEHLRQELGTRAEPEAQTLHGDVERYLGTEPREPSHHETLRQRLQNGLTFYEAKHPALASAIEKVLNQLISLGL